MDCRLKCERGVMEEEGSEVIAQPLSEPWCVTAHEMKCTDTNPKSYLKELHLWSWYHMIHIYLPLLCFLSLLLLFLLKHTQRQALRGVICRSYIFIIKWQLTVQLFGRIYIYKWQHICKQKLCIQFNNISRAPFNRWTPSTKTAKCPKTTLPVF